MLQGSDGPERHPEALNVTLSGSLGVVRLLPQGRAALLLGHHSALLAQRGAEVARLDIEVVDHPRRYTVGKRPYPLQRLQCLVPLSQRPAPDSPEAGGMTLVSALGQPMSSQVIRR